MQTKVEIQTLTTDPNYVQPMTLDQTMASDQDQAQPMTAEDQAAELDNRIKQLDSATMIFSFLFFITFALVYWIKLLS